MAAGLLAPLLFSLAACGSSGGAPADKEEFSRRLNEANEEIEPLVPSTVAEALSLRGGHAAGEIVTLADGSKVNISAVSPNGGGVVAEYVLVGAVDDADRITRVTRATVSGEPYVPGTVAGSFTYSGRTVALLGREGGELRRMIGTAALALDFDAGTGRLTSDAEAGNRRADVSGDVAFSRATGAIRADALELRYRDSQGTLTEAAGLRGSVRGDNAGFSALYEATGQGVAGKGVVTGLRVDP